MAEIGGTMEADNELALRLFIALLETAGSKQYVRIYARRDGKACLTCLRENGKIFLPDEPGDMARYAQQATTTTKPLLKYCR